MKSGSHPRSPRDVAREKARSRRKPKQVTRVDGLLNVKSSSDRLATAFRARIAPLWAPGLLLRRVGGAADRAGFESRRLPKGGSRVRISHSPPPLHMDGCPRGLWALLGKQMGCASSHASSNLASSATIDKLDKPRYGGKATGDVKLPSPPAKSSLLAGGCMPEARVRGVGRFIRLRVAR